MHCISDTRRKCNFLLKKYCLCGIKIKRKQEGWYDSETNKQLSRTGSWNSGNCSMFHMPGPGTGLVLLGWFWEVSSPPRPCRQVFQRAPPLWCPHCSTSQGGGQLWKKRTRPNWCWKVQALGRDLEQSYDPVAGLSATWGSVCSSTGVFRTVMAVLPPLFSISPALH